MKEQLQPVNLTNPSETPYPGVRAPNQNKYGSGLSNMAENQAEVPTGGSRPPETPQTPRETVGVLERAAREVGQERELSRFVLREREAPEIQEAKLRGIIEKEQETLDKSPELSENRVYLEGVFNQIRNAQGSIAGEFGAVDRRLRELYDLRDKGEIKDPAEFASQIKQLSGERAAIEARMAQAEPYGEAIQRRIAELARLNPDRYLDRSVQEQTARTIREVEEIRQREGDYEATKRLKQIVGPLNVEDHIDPRLLDYIAKDPEASDLFLDSIISKPFAHPTASYDQYIGFYAGVNRLAFLDAVRSIDARREERYGQLSAASHHLHEMNRTILSESGNPEAFVSYARIITHTYLQAATELDGVEQMRQLLELAYGRLYAKTERVTGDNFGPEIEGWAVEELRKLARAGVIRSHFLGPDGKTPRELEQWEIDRAIAFGRNLSTSFYRQSELISWSKIPRPWERWIESFPTEFVVRAMGGGFKWLIYRFRIGTAGGGRELTVLVLNKIKKMYKGTLEKIGKLDIAEDLYPVGHFKGGGFDKGWRTFQAYWRTNVMRISLPQVDVSTLPEKEQEFIEEFGYRPTLGDFIFEKEYMAQVVAAEERIVEGVEVPEELRMFDPDKVKDLLAKDLIPLLGFRPYDRNEQEGRDYKYRLGDYVYDPRIDQIHFNFGTLISFWGLNETVKTMLWAKTAEVLPLRIAYFLSEEGVKKEVPGYQNVKGKGKNLFSDEFESKLIALQMKRMAKQAREQEEAYEGGRPAQAVALDLEDSEGPVVGLSEKEKEFVRALIEFGKKKASQLALVDFPHVPFLDDTPFQRADYVRLRGETAPRRLGGDFQAFVQINGEEVGIWANLERKYEDILDHFRKIVDFMSIPEDKPTGQNTVFPILESYLELSRQWALTKIPFVKTVANFLGLPTSWMQKFFGPNAPSDDESELNLKVRMANERNIVRREKLPGEEKSQVNKLLESLGAKWYNVLGRELRNASVIFLLFMILEFFKKVKEEK